jgi:hypothetical protein
MWCTTFDAVALHVRFDEGDVETGLGSGYLGTARRKGRKQTNHTYGYRATFPLYRTTARWHFHLAVPKSANIVIPSWPNVRFTKPE